eukprot:TRINITY_DN3869_c0_g1_i1.p1 TRINITY_DN3869_c0_g1~~TRINITY_DN3869_c0_g1_i1.p1  ORF type:complete len:151 (-),score=43.36 TRINITY_DN3869_c0_g1_i1:69-521(-)
MTMAVAYDIVPLLSGLLEGDDPKNPTNYMTDPKWLAICTHCKYFASLMLRSFTLDQVMAIQDLSLTVHTLMTECWPELMKMNKPHWDLHTVVKILELGPVWLMWCLINQNPNPNPVSYTHLRAHETVLDLVCRLLLEKKKKKISISEIIT